jgi:hypothetical protein
MLGPSRAKKTDGSMHSPKMTNSILNEVEVVGLSVAKLTNFRPATLPYSLNDGAGTGVVPFTRESLK